jgi:iron complex outermembrane receptor protein
LARILAYHYFYLLFSACLLCLSAQSWAQQTCTWSVRGKIINAATGEPMPFANVFVREKNIGATADAEGHYILANLCEGDYTLVCSMVGCNHVEHEVYVRTHISYDFLLQETAVTLDKVVVAAKIGKLQHTQASEEVSGAALLNTQGLPFAESLKRLPGVTTLYTGATIAKPVIQGLHSNRILMLNNGVRVEGQQWGVEHAPEIDPFLADRVQVVKGASSVRYGSDAIGGVILVEPRALPETPGIGGQVNLAGFSNGRTGVLSGMLHGKLSGKLPLSGRIQGTLKRGGNLHTPDYFLQNTGVQEYNFSWAAGLQQGKYHIEAFYTRFYTQLGILRSAHIGNVSDLLNAIERERPLEDGAFTYALGRPQQRISHELAKVKASRPTGDIGKLSLQLTRQFNHRREFDAHRLYNRLPDAIDQPSIQFEITTHTADLVWEHKPIHHLRGDVGVHIMRQANTTDRGALIPNFVSYNGSAFWIERWKRYPAPIELEAGVRYDYKTIAIGRQGRRDIDETLQFSNVSGTFGAIYKFPKLALLRANIGSAWRAPHVSELYSDGVHHGSASYERGNPQLRTERALNTHLSAELDNDKNLRATLTVYYNLIRDFIFLEPQAQPQLTIRGAFPAFYYAQTNARLAGLDWGMDYELVPGWTLESKAAFIRARNQALQDHLIWMPADQFQHGLKYTFRHTDATDLAPFIRLTMVNVLEQTRVPANFDYAPPPPAYTRFDLEAATTVRWRKQPIEIGLLILNLTNERYREYLNRFRYFVDEPGRNISLRIRVPFGVQ